MPKRPPHLALPSIIAAAVVLGASALLPGPAAEARAELPVIGDPADRVLSPREEAEIGRRLLTQAQQSLTVNRDPQTTAYLDRLGQRLAREAGEPPIDGYTFFVVHNHRINAFAAPGGYIGVNTGLIREAETEAQLAGVLSHEIAHVSQRHIARSIAAAERGSYATVAAVLAGILLGAANPQAGQAAIIGGLAGEQQRQINYTRTVEYEADRIGIRILADAGFEPEGMAEFFDILLRQEMGASDIAPEYLRTHPLSGNRVAEARNRATGLQREGLRRDSLEFQLMRTRLAVLDSNDPAALYHRWENQRAPQGSDMATARDYGLALLELEMNRSTAAAERITRLRREDRDNLYLTLAAGAAARAMGDHEQALDLYAGAADLYPSSWPAELDRAETLIRMDRPDEAAGHLTGFVRSQSRTPPEVWRMLARANREAGRERASHEALAEYYLGAHDYGRAAGQLELAQELSEPNSNAHSRIEARLRDVNALRRGQMADMPIRGAD